jgi:hypothetical protein
MTLATITLMAAGCASSSAQINTPDAWDQREADPELARGAELALSHSPPAADGWQVGVVLAEDPDEWAVAVLTDAGVAYLDSHAGGGCDWEPPQRFAAGGRRVGFQQIAERLDVNLRRHNA